jgi:flavin-dependent dehydrogenase
VTVPLPAGRGTYAAVAPRLQLDAALVELAGKAGAVVVEGHGFAGSLTDHGHHVLAALDDGRSVAARYVIAADGMWSPVRKAIGLGDPGYRGEWHAFRQYVTGVTGPAAEQLFVWFEADFLPGYAWSFPLPDGRANVGFGVRRDGRLHGAALKRQWAGLLERPHVRAALGPAAALEGRHAAWPIPARIDRTPLARGRVLITGDAAAATDVMTGEGIGQAFVTGRLAAEAVLAAGALAPAAARRRYTRDVRRHLVADHRMSAALGAVLAHERGARGAIRVLERSGDWGRRNFARWMFEDEPRALLLTPRRWHRRILSRPGVGR